MSVYNLCFSKANLLLLHSESVDSPCHRQNEMQKMKSTIILALLTMGATHAFNAQTVVPKDSVQLQEVMVRGARVVNRIDGKLLFPSEEMTK